jgi:hypothetical protein
LVRWFVRPSVGWLVGPHITSKTDYVAIALRRGEGRENWLMSKTGYVKIASRLVTVARSCLSGKHTFSFKKTQENILLPLKKIRKNLRKKCVFLNKKMMRTENFLISSHHDISMLTTFRKKKRFP